jgi:beta-glucosidase
MEPRPQSVALTLIASICVAWALAGQAACSAAPGPVSVSAETEARITALLSRMTLEEKAGQLNQLSAGALSGPGSDVGEDQEKLIRAGSVGSLLNAVTARETDAFQKDAVESSRMHIPILFGYDVIHGFHTTFPIPLALSASWDPGLVEDTANRAAREAAAEGVRWVFSPMVDIARDARWGRISEGAGEDPYLGAAMARAYVRGYQGKSLGEPGTVIACEKHFVGYGAVEGGREYNSTEISERLLRDVYLVPFRAGVDEGAGTLMSAFNSVNGVPSSANRFTLTDVLRGEWGFGGFVVSDWTAIHELTLHGVARDDREAARKAFLAGVDMDMESRAYVGELPGLVRAGKVPEARLDDAVRRVLRFKFALGLFGSPYARTATLESGLGLAQRAAEESFVLLRNEPSGARPLLPLTLAKGGKVALIGPLSDSADDMLGAWAGQGNPADAVSLKTALVERAGRDGFTVATAAGTDEPESAAEISKAVETARSADIVVLALGERRSMSGEASARSRLDLPGNQEDLLEAVVAAGKPVVLVVFSGRPLALPWAASHVASILEAWFPGLEAGPALVRTLFGDTEPTGRLTASFPRSVGQEPLYYNCLNTGRPRSDPIGMGDKKVDPYYITGYIDEKNTALFPFGSGLGYTTFGYSGVTASRTEASASALERGDDRITVSAQVTNTGARPGVETVQCYIRLRGTSVARPVHELKGFRRLQLAPGESRRVEFTLGREELSFWNIEMKHRVEPADLYVWIAPDSTQGSPAKVEITE